MNLGLETGQEADALITALTGPAQAARLWSVRTLPKGAACFEAADASSDVFLLLSGLVKLVYTTETGEDWIKSFVLDRGVFSGRGASDAPTGQSYGAVCLESCRFVRLPRPFVARLVATDQKVGQAYGAFSAWVLARKQAREATLLTMTPEARFRNLLTKAPEALARLPQADVARFLGITPIAFSRIKRRIQLSTAMNLTKQG